MTRSRVADWAIGALGVLVLLAVGLVLLWWFATESPDDAGPPPSSPSPTAVPPDAPPPADLASDEVWIGDLDLQSAVVVLPDSTLLDVEAQGHGARSGPDGLRVDRLSVRATVPFADVESELGGDSRVRAAEDGQAAVERTVEVLGRQLGVVATGTVEVEDGLLVVEPTMIDVGGSDALSRLIATLVRQFVTIKQPIPGLPPNLELRAVEVQEDGFRAQLEGRDVVLSAMDS